MQGEMCKFDKFWVKFERIDFFSPPFSQGNVFDRCAWTIQGSLTQ